MNPFLDNPLGNDSDSSKQEFRLASSLQSKNFFKNFSRKKWFALILLLLLIPLSTFLALNYRAILKPFAKPEDKIRVCHYTGDEKSPYVSIDANKQGDVDGHAGSSHQNGKDIIPPFDYKDNDENKHFPGQNWDGREREIHNNNCQLPSNLPKQAKVSVVEGDVTYDCTNPSSITRHFKFQVTPEDREANAWVEWYLAPPDTDNTRHRVFEGKVKHNQEVAATATNLPPTGGHNVHFDATVYFDVDGNGDDNGNNEHFGTGTDAITGWDGPDCPIQQEQKVFCDSLTLTPLSGNAPLSVTASATGHTTGGGSVVSYKFNFGSGDTTTNTHTFTKPGTYTVTAKAIDNKGQIAGGSGACRKTISVTEVPPTPVTATCDSLTLTPTSGTAPVSITAGVTGSVQNTTINQYHFDFGDGSSSVYQTSNSATHTFSTPGTYTIKSWLKINDPTTSTGTREVGGTGACLKTITIAAAPVQQVVCDSVSITPSSGTAPLEVTTTISGHTVNGGSVASYVYNFGSGDISSTEQSRAFTFTTEGTYTIKGWVVDNLGKKAGGSGNCLTSVTVSSVPQQTYRTCQNFACVTLSGPGTSSCSNDKECENYRTCQNNACVTVSGKGINSCSNDQECLSYKTCRNNACITVSGSGISSCSQNSDCTTTIVNTPNPPTTTTPSKPVTVANPEILPEAGNTLSTGVILTGAATAILLGLLFLAF